MSGVPRQTGFPGGVALGPGLIPDSEEQAAAVRCAIFNNPALADVDRFVTSTNMKVGAYTLAQTTPTDGLARNVTVTVTAGATADTMGTVTVVGKNLLDETITETITPVAGSTVAGTKAFKSITSVTGAGWAIDGVEGTNDTITVGFGNLIGLPFKLRQTSDVVAILGGTSVVGVAAAAAALSTAGGVEGDDDIADSTIDASGITFDGAKDVVAIVRA